MSGRIAVLGGGAWGTALAVTMLRAGHEVRLWARDSETVDAINERRENPRYLPGVKLDAGLIATTDLGASLAGADIVLSVIPTQATRAVLGEAAAFISAASPLVLAAKGIERTTGRLVSEIAREILPDTTIAALSGPSFAADVVRGLPTAVTVASEDESQAFALAERLSAPAFRCYSTDDLVGVEIGGALKNVLAIAAGAVSGAGLGASAQAATITRGFVELRRIGAAFCARSETLMGLSGLGDLMLTCASTQSRNFAYGVALGEGRDRTGMKLAEGAATAGIALSIARDKGVDVPIIEATAELIAGHITMKDAATRLLSRPLKSETD
ncbi:NAD(P)H-dependent glycerol-3-phosphate dehydrogenase [Aliihoeflea sp. PC F10.4]